MTVTATQTVFVDRTITEAAPRVDYGYCQSRVAELALNLQIRYEEREKGNDWPVTTYWDNLGAWCASVDDLNRAIAGSALLQDMLTKFGGAPLPTSKEVWCERYEDWSQFPICA